MAKRPVFAVNYRRRLTAVSEALHTAEQENRVADAEALRLAEGLLRAVLAEREKAAARKTA